MFDGFDWTVAAGRRDLGPQHGFPSGAVLPEGMSPDGTTLVGRVNSFPDGRQAFRWSESRGFQTLGRQTGATSSTAFDASHDGSVVVGVSEAESGQIGQAFRWTEQGGLQPLGYSRPNSYYSAATAVNVAGDVIVGDNRSAGGLYTAWIHTMAGGMQELPPLPGTGVSLTEAHGINLAGDIVVGTSGSPGRFVKWTNGVAESLDLPAGVIRAKGSAVNEAGDVVVGSLFTQTGFYAAIWTPQHGTELLSAYLTRQGISVPAGYNLRDATEVSADGRVIAGYTGGGGSPVEGFVVYIPAPSTAWGFGAGLLAAMRRRR